MSALPQDPTAAQAGKIGSVIDHLVDALGGEPGCTMRRALVLADIDEHPNTTQSDIVDRLNVHKSALTRDIEWLYDYGCITRTPSPKDARETHLRICGYAKKNLDLALGIFDNSHKSLKNFLSRFINMFGEYKPTLRDAKIIAVIGSLDDASRQQVFEGLYNGPATTENRALKNLVELGFIKKED